MSDNNNNNNKKISILANTIKLKLITLLKIVGEKLIVLKDKTAKKLSPYLQKLEPYYNKAYSFVFLDNEKYNNSFRIKRIILFVAFAAILQITITTCSVFLVVKTGGKTVKLQNVQGLNMFDAFQILQKDGLVLKIEPNFFFDKELGTVVLQEPRAGTRVKEGRVITLVVNAVVESALIMPDLIGKTEKEAFEIITNNILSKNKNVIIEPSNETTDRNTEAGLILSQLPFANEPILNDTKILLTVNRERKINTVLIDNYTNKNIKTVMSYFDSYRIPFTIKYVDNDSMNEKVIEQSIKMGDYKITEIKDVVFTVGKKAGEKIKTEKLQYTFPLDKVEDNNTLKIVLDDEKGRTTLYDKSVKAGDTIYFSYRVFTGGTITIFHNNEPVETRNIN